MWTPRMAALSMTAHDAAELKSPTIKRLRTASVVSPAEGFGLDPSKPHISNLTVKKNHLGNLLKCRFPGGTTRNSPSVRLG